MRRIQNITNETFQRHTILLDEFEVIMKLRFYPKSQIWCFDAEYKTQAVRGIKLSVGVPHIVSQNFPFDFAVTDRSNNGLDPFRRDDFSEGRCYLYILDPADMEIIRGVEVPL